MYNKGTKKGSEENEKSTKIKKNKKNFKKVIDKFKKVCYNKLSKEIKNVFKRKELIL